MERAGSLVGAGVDHSNTENGDFWTDMTKSVVRAYLLASARADLPISRVIRWAGAPTDPEPVTLLQQHGQHEWARELSEQAKADPKQRGSVWAGVVRGRSTASRTQSCGQRSTVCHRRGSNRPRSWREGTRSESSAQRRFRKHSLRWWQRSSRT
jgi:hypothetical protein